MIVCAVMALVGLFGLLFTNFWNGDLSLSMRALSSMPKVETQGVRLDALGTDLRAYEWVSPSDATVTCVFVISSKGQSGIDCF
jgi:hypothetical protein